MTEDPTSLKPIIKELVRTQVCFSDVKLLVDRIAIVRLQIFEEATSREAYLLYLTDREKTIQAVVGRRLHKTINYGEIREGSFVVLREYQLARGQRVNGGGQVVYLKISDFFSIGEEERKDVETMILEPAKALNANEKNGRESDLEEHAAQEDMGDLKAGVVRKAKESPTPNYPNSPTKNPSHIEGDLAETARIDAPTPSQDTPSQKRKRDSALSELNSNPCKRDGESGILDSYSAGARLKQLETDRTKTGGKSATTQDEHSAYSAAQTSQVPSRYLLTSSKASYTKPDTLQPITRPLKLSPLASVTGPNRSKNEVHDILAVITHVDAHTYKPPHMPRKRDLRIMDTSTSKRVILSVFTDPVGFEPEVGTVALFRNLTTHDWDGGNLKAYPWLCEAKGWFLPASEDLHGGTGIEGVERGEIARLVEC